MKSNLIRKINMECPLCDRIHEIEERTRETKMIVKGKEVKYMESYYFCPNTKEDENAAYRKQESVYHFRSLCHVW